MRFRKLVAGALMASALTVGTVAHAAGGYSLSTPVVASASGAGDRLDGNGNTLTYLALVLSATALALAAYDLSRSP